MTAVVSPPLRPDPRLPHRDRLLQEDFVAEWLSAHLGASGPVPFDTVVRARVKYRIGESLRVVYRLRAGSFESTVAARMFHAGRSARAFARASAAATAVGGLRGVSYAPQLDTVFWTFPNDRKLADLALLGTPAPALARALGLPAVRTRLVAYAPEKSATAACLADSGAVVAYAKSYAEDEARRVRGIYRDVHRALPKAPGGLGVPRLLAPPASPRTLMLGAIEGAPLSNVPSGEASAGMQRLGAALAALHALPAPTEPFTRLAHPRLARAASVIAGVRPDVAGLAGELARALGRLCPADEPHVRLHGDVHPRNAIVAAGHVALVDLDQSAAGPAATDLGSFLAHLGCERVIGRLAPEDERRLAGAFLGGYAAHRDLPRADSLRWHAAAALLAERALRAVERLRPDALTHLGAILAAAAGLLTEEGP